MCVRTCMSDSVAQSAHVSASATHQHSVTTWCNGMVPLHTGTVERINLAIALIWRFGGLLDDRQNKMLALIENVLYISYM